MSEDRTQFEIEETIRNEEHARREEYGRTEEVNQRYNNN
jgi:hypothetical protein